MLKPGTRIGGVLIHDLVGRGAMGEVYHGEQVALRRPVAVKRIAPHLADRPEILARFEREARLVAALATPNVVSVYDFGTYPDEDGERHVLLVMEWVPGGTSLGRILGARKQLDWRQATALILQVAQGLAVAHTAGVTHRDIKPDNILLSADGTAKLADFGLATAADVTAMTQEGATIGTPNYMAPEACRAEPLTTSADIYSLGATWFHLVAGQPPYQAESTMALLMAHCNAPIPDPRELEAELPDSIANLMTSCMAKDPEARPASATALVERLEALVAEGIVLPKDLSELAEELGEAGMPSTMGTEIATDAATKVMQESGPNDETLPATSDGGSASAAATAPTAIPGPSGAAADPPPSRRRLPWILVLVLLGLAAGGTLAAVLVLGADPLAEDRAKVEAAVERGDHALALTTADRLLQEHPDDPKAHAILRAVIDDQVDELIAEERFEDALEVIATAKQERSWLDIDEWDIRIRLAQADRWVQVGHIRNAEDVFFPLLEDYPTEPRIKRAHIEAAGAGPEDPKTTRGAIWSALALAEDHHAGGPFDPVVGETLLAGLRWLGAESDEVPHIMDLVAEHYREPATRRAEAWLDDPEDWPHRIIGFKLLDALGEIDEHERLRWHVRIVTTMPHTYSTQMERSQTFVREAMGRDDWAARKDAAGITSETFADVATLDRWGERGDAHAQLLTAAFAPEIAPHLATWAADTDEAHRRWHAYRMAQAIDGVEPIDPWDFHQQTLSTFDTTYTPDVLRAALDFYKAKAGRPDRVLAIKALRAGRERLVGIRDEATERELERWRVSAQRNLELVEETLQALETD